MSIDFVEKYPNYKEYFVAENLILSGILVAVSFILIVANRLKKPTLYWPFICFMV
jgi:hypothetical protein